MTYTVGHVQVNMNLGVFDLWLCTAERASDDTATAVDTILSVRGDCVNGASCLTPEEKAWTVCEGYVKGSVIRDPRCIGGEVIYLRCKHFRRISLPL